MPTMIRDAAVGLIILSATLALSLALGAGPARAVEGGASHYITGAYGDFLMGYIPGPGLFIRNDTFYQSAHMDSTFKGGKIYAGIDETMVMNITKLSYLFDVPAMGGFLGIGVGVPIIINEHITGEVSADYTLRSRQTGIDQPHSLDIDGGGDRGGLSDIFIMPVIAGWNLGECHLVVSPIIFLPTGYYNPDKLTNLGMNYLTFDGNVAFTWLSKSGFELSVNAGYMVNTENMTTGYLSGNQIHADWTLACHVNDRFALGAVGYLLAQTTPDSGEGATMGGFASSGTGIGPIVTYTLPVAGKDVMLVAKWLHGLGATNSFLGDSIYGSFAMTF
ncbi:SphA family protein [Desulfolutivibrio sulfoxidireducens]|uniref:SphA family protein n=1 Tax=Desulfolutivibrio sulfoxidireducens TaxID=2773299 RepID=UPI00159D0680|nr:transporter [Desulfolutivibrio sulfoxidireducens]QLA17229.1 transporter [Desulfolutivibrio sulfoxidireducens]QLA20796.1 transporter [Desulfolutivibrio sulfoxidireducens]